MYIFIKQKLEWDGTTVVYVRMYIAICTIVKGQVSQWRCDAVEAYTEPGSFHFGSSGVARPSWLPGLLGVKGSVGALF